MTIAVSPIRLRPMTPADIPAVTDIERLSFPSSWPPTAYQRELEQNSLARYLVAVDRGGRDDRGRRAAAVARLREWFGAKPVPAPAPDEPILGFLGLWFMVDEAHIVSVAVHPDARRRGIGEALVAEAIDLARGREAEMVTLEVRISNTGAQALYEKYGFARVGVRKRYYTDNNEDALIMTTPRLSDNAYRSRLAELRTRYTARYGVVQVEG